MRGPLRKRRMSSCTLISMVLGIFVALVASAAAQSKGQAKDPGKNQPDPWLILATGETGTIHAKTARAELVSTFGAANVVDQDIDIGEGETEPGTVVFPNEPKQLIEILWKDPAAKRDPKSVTIHGEASRWKAVHDISLGTSLKDLERINAKPFHLSGFAWDYSGTVTAWDGGLLEDDLEKKARVYVRLHAPARPDVTDKELEQVAGDREFSSQHPVMQKLNPRVYMMVWMFP
jgi:hypothetical protein